MAKIDIYFIVLGSILFDFLVGDPKFLIHPVQIIGFCINKIYKTYLKFFKERFFLVLGGLLLFLFIFSTTYLSAKYLELKYLQSENNILWGLIIFVGISSCLATKNLLSSVIEISKLIEKKSSHKKYKQVITNKVQRLVSRDVSSLSEEHLLRSATESLTENSVDGIFGPLFWILIGAFCIKYSIYLPGPLSLGLSYKAISTLDSMIGYKYMPFKYLGFFSAKIEDYITYIPCRLVVFTLPLVSIKIGNYLNLIQKTFEDGGKYESPNSGISEGIFAFITDIQLGGENKYREKKILKPIINYGGNKCNQKSIEQICGLIIRLQLLWIVIFSVIFFII